MEIQYSASVRPTSNPSAYENMENARIGGAESQHCRKQRRSFGASQMQRGRFHEVGVTPRTAKFMV